MSKIDDSTRLLHMRDAAIEAIRFAADQSRKNLDSNRMLTLALVKEIETPCHSICSRFLQDSHTDRLR